LGQLGDGTGEARPIFDRKLLSQRSFDVRLNAAGFMQELDPYLRPAD